MADLLDESWGKRYAARIGTWRMPASAARKDELALAYGRDGRTLLTAVYAAAARDPGLAFLARLHRVEVLRVVLVQNYVTVEDKRGREVIKRREAEVEGLPPGRSRITSPYDTDARWSVKRGTFWNGYKVHVTETCATSAAAGGTAAGSDSGSDAHGDDGEAVAPRPSASRSRAKHSMSARRTWNRCSWCCRHQLTNCRRSSSYVGLAGQAAVAGEEPG